MHRVVAVGAGALMLAMGLGTGASAADDPGDAGWQLLSRAAAASDAALRRDGGTWRNTAISRNEYLTVYDIVPGAQYLRERSYEPGNSEEFPPDEETWFAKDSAWEYRPYALPKGGGTPALIPSAGWSKKPADDPAFSVPSVAYVTLYSGPYSDRAVTPLATTVTRDPDDAATTRITFTRPNDRNDPAKDSLVTVVLSESPDGEPLVTSVSDVPVTQYYGNESETRLITYGARVRARPPGWKAAVPESYVSAAWRAVASTKLTSQVVRQTTALGRRLSATERPVTVISRMRAYLEDANVSDSPGATVRSTPTSVVVVDTNRYTGQRITWTLTPTDGRLTVRRMVGRVSVAPLPAR